MIKKIFDWNLEDFIKAILGVVLMSFAINLFIIPIGIYNGGILGISQLINSFVINSLNFIFHKFSFLLIYIFNNIIYHIAPT